MKLKETKRRLRENRSIESDDEEPADAAAEMGCCLGLFRELPQCALVPARSDGQSRLDAPMLRCEHGRLEAW